MLEQIVRNPSLGAAEGFIGGLNDGEDICVVVHHFNTNTNHSIIGEKMQEIL